MKKYICLFSFLGVFSISLFAAKVTYNKTPLTNGSATIWLTCSCNESRQYIVTIEGENLQGIGGTYFNPGTVPLNTTITTNTSTKIVCTITAVSSPKFYTPLYVLMPGEVSFNEIQDKDIDWGSGGSCDLPRMISASVESVEGTTASVRVNATDAVTPSADLRYNYILTQGEDVRRQDNVSATNGILPLTGLLPGKTYTLEIWAVDGDNNVSANSASVTFTTDIEEGQCNFFGSKGDGQKHDPSFSPFNTGYKVSLYLNSTKDSIWITAKLLDTDQTATSALMQNYPNRKEAEGVEETRLDRVGDSQVFKGKVSIASFKNRADGIIRFGIKFEYPNGGIRVTTPEFYYLDGSGCAERDFVIYHHHQKPEKPADAEREAVESFAGGRILQPIQYKRRLRPDVWETLSIPFEVDSVTVTDKDGVYKIYPQYDNNGTVEGEFWLRDFRENEVSAEDFQKNWHDIQATSPETALPKKNVPYIIRVPDDDTHYWADKYIVFHGASYQTIDDVYHTDVQTPRAKMFAYSGNNTMEEWQLHSVYVLDNEGIYFESGETVTLYPFECAVNAEQATIAKMPRLSLNKRPDTATDSKIPTTAMQAGSVWTLMGGYVGAFGNVDEYDALLQRLPEGVYIVSRGEQVDKLYLVK